MNDDSAKGERLLLLLLYLALLDELLSPTMIVPDILYIDVVVVESLIFSFNSSSIGSSLFTKYASIFPEGRT